MDVQAFAEQAYTLFTTVSAQAEELQQRAVQRLVDNISSQHEAWSTEKLHSHEQLQAARERAQVLEGKLQTYQEEQALQRQQHADEILEASSKLHACQEILQQAESNAAKESQQQADVLAKTRDQLQVALEYRKKCRSQQAEIKHLQHKIAGLQAKQQHVSEQSWRADNQPAHQHNQKKSLSASGSLQKPAKSDPMSLQPFPRSRQIMPGAGADSQDAFTQDDQMLCSQVDGLLQRLQEAEKRVQVEVQKRHAERKNVRAVLRKRDEELKALKAENESFRRQLMLLGALQPRQRSGSDAPRTASPQECEATSRPTEVCARQGRQQAQQPKTVIASAITPEASGGDVAGTLGQSRAHDSASALKSALRAGSGSCSRAAQYKGKQGKGISPSKRAMPDVASVAAAQQRATPAKRPKREACSMADMQRQSAGSGSVPSDRHAASAPGTQPKQQAHLRAMHVKGTPPASTRTLQPADMAHLQSAQNVRNSQEAEHGEPGNGSHLTESPQAPPSMSLSQLASMAVPLCQPANEHAHRSTVGELSMRAGVPDNLQAASMKPTCRASVERNAAAEAVNTEALQPELVTRPPSTAESSEAELQLEQGLEKPQDAPQVAAKPAALEIPVSPVLPAVPEEGADLVLALVKEESLKESPAWKVRAAREAAQHAGNTLFPDICQPDLAEEDLGDPEGVGLLTQLLGPNRHTAHEQHRAGASWKTRQREGLCPGALAFLDVAHVQRSSNSRVCQQLPVIVDRHSPKGPQLPQDAQQAGTQNRGLPGAGSGYKYKEVARKRAEREAMLGVECPDCQRFYEACQTWNSIAPAALPQCGHAIRDLGQKAGVAGPPERVTRDQLRQNASRHRYHYAPPPTPPGFWDMGFMDTQDSRNIGQKDQDI